MQQHAANAQQQPQIGVGFGGFGIAAKAVADAAVQLTVQKAKNGQSIRVGCADMQNYWQIQLVGQQQLPHKPVFLGQAVLFLAGVVIIQTGFPDGHHPGPAGILPQLFKIGQVQTAAYLFIVFIQCGVGPGAGGMHPHRLIEKSRQFLRKGQQPGIGFQLDPRLDTKTDTFPLQLFYQVVPVAGL